MSDKSQISIPDCISGENSALFINHYLKLFGTLCCIVPNITLPLIYQIKLIMKPKSFTLILFLLAAMVVAGLRTNAQSVQPTVGHQELYQEIAKQDSLLFNAFNTRDIDLFKTMFTEDLEFYHDKGGLTGYEHTIDFLKTTAQGNNQLKRELEKGSLEVYPIPGYGAMEIGMHRFCHLDNGKQNCGTFKFVHIWQKKDNQWKITRVISYDH